MTDSSGGAAKRFDYLPFGGDLLSTIDWQRPHSPRSLASISGNLTESRTYNSIGQMTQLSSGSISLQYNYSSTQNNGKITSEHNLVSGETVTYTYDSLNRLATATSSDTPGWGQSYSYDGFGNLTTVAVTQGSAPSLSTSYSASTNRNVSADANGNLGYGGDYDVENRLTNAGGMNYTYAPGNKRVLRRNGSTVDELTYYSVTGQRLATFALASQTGTTWNGSTSVGWAKISATATQYFTYFGGKTLDYSQDRLGSNGKYFPYGDERPSATANDKIKFASYTRDSESGLDYAQNRYYQSGTGRFRTADPYAGSGHASDPGSWNKYSYVGGDPVNYNDSIGLFRRRVTSPTVFPESPNCVVSFWLAECGSYVGGVDYDVCSIYPDTTGCPGHTTEQPQLPVNSAGGGSPTSVTHAVNWVDNPWAGLAAAIQGTKCETWLQGGFAKSNAVTPGISLNQYLTAPDQLQAITGSADFVGGTAQAITGNVPGGENFLVLFKNGGFFFDDSPGFSLPSTNNKLAIGGIQGGTPQAKAFLLLHELGHVLGLFKSDDGNDANQKLNNDTMWFNCSSIVLGAK